jgi:hypothetical protein
MLKEKNTDAGSPDDQEHLLELTHLSTCNRKIKLKPVHTNKTGLFNESYATR